MAFPALTHGSLSLDAVFCSVDSEFQTRATACISKFKLLDDINTWMSVFG
jgi:hypothetical protein